MIFSWKKKLPANAGILSEGKPRNTAPLPFLPLYVLHQSSEKGPVRSSNEDAICTSYPNSNNKTLFAMVADGMGGHNAGEVASSMACQLMTQWVSENYFSSDAARMLSDGLLKTHKIIFEEATADENKKGMGTTATALLLRNGVLHYAHVGDSRLYMSSGGHWQQITTDHTLTNQMISKGEITIEDAKDHPLKNYITQAVGFTQSIVPDFSEVSIPVQIGDRYLLVSDGVYDVLTSEEIGELLQLSSPSLIMECLGSLCNSRRSSDNFSIILIGVAEEDNSDAAITREQNIQP